MVDTQFILCDLLLRLFKCQQTTNMIPESKKRNYVNRFSIKLNSNDRKITHKIFDDLCVGLKNCKKVLDRFGLAFIFIYKYNEHVTDKLVQEYFFYTKNIILKTDMALYFEEFFSDAELCFSSFDQPLYYKEKYYKNQQTCLYEYINSVFRGVVNTANIQMCCSLTDIFQSKLNHQTFIDTMDDLKQQSENKNIDKMKKLQEHDQLGFQGTQQLKRHLIICFQKNCWIYVSNLLDQSLYKTKSKQDQLYFFRRYENFELFTMFILNITIQETKEENKIYDEYLCQKNIEIIKCIWIQDFIHELQTHINVQGQEITHPHPVSSFNPYKNIQGGMFQQKHQNVKHQLKMFNPFIMGLRYCLPSLTFLYKIAMQLSLDDESRNNYHSSIMLCGQGGSGKSWLIDAINKNFNGYKWQKKKTCFQSKQIQSASILVVEEFDSKQLVDNEQTLNQWKQLLDQQQSAYCDYKGVQGVNCTKNMPVIMCCNQNQQYFLQNYDNGLLRKIFFIHFSQNLEEFFVKNIHISKKVIQQHIDVGQDMLHMQVCNTVLVFIFLLQPFNQKIYLDKKTCKQISEVLVYNRNNMFLRLLFDTHKKQALLNSFFYQQNEDFINNCQTQNLIQKNLDNPQNPYSQMIDFFVTNNDDKKEYIEQLKYDIDSDHGFYMLFSEDNPNDGIDKIWSVQTLKDEVKKTMNGRQYVQQIIDCIDDIILQ